MIALVTRLQSCSPFQWGLETLLDMLRFNGDRLVRLIGLLSKLDMPDLVYRAGRMPDVRLEGEMKESVLCVFRDFADALDLPGFTLSRMQLGRLKDEIEGDRTTYSSLAAGTIALRFRIEDELSLTMVWQVPPAVAKLFESDLFGSEVSRAFPSAALDIEEAGKCLGLGRTTACVFHLMRATEAALNVIARRIKHPDQRPMWGPILSFLDKQLGLPYDQMPDYIKGDLEFMSGISAQMHAINVAWRRRVAHIERSYNEDEATRIFEATKGLMQHLAAKLSEPEDARGDA